MNGPSASEVDAAVRAVLGERTRRRANPGAPAFVGRLLGIKQVEALSGLGGELRISAATVVTPLAREQLKRLGIRVTIVAQAESNGQGERGEFGFVIEPRMAWSDALRRALHADSARWHDLGDDPRDATRWVIEAEHRAAVAITAEASVATWRANQTAGIRAATVAEADAVARACIHLGANLIVIETAGQSIYSIQHLFRTFHAAGAPRPPADWPKDENHADRGGHWPGHALAAASGAETGNVPDRRAPAPRSLAGAGFTTTW